MPDMTLSALTQPFAPAMNPLLSHAVMAKVPTGLTLDSRTVAPGDAFIALSGHQLDGRQFVDEALMRGAMAVITEADAAQEPHPAIVAIPNLKLHVGEIARRYFEDPSSELSMIAVTGTNGKTSITDYIGQLLRLLGESSGTIGTLGARTQSTQSVEALNTTPDVVSLNRCLAVWRDRGIRHVAIEASSHALAQGRLNGLRIHTGVFSNLTRDHLDYHGDLDGYRQAKLKLFSDFALQRVIYNADDEATHGAVKVSSCPAVGVSLTDPLSDVHVKIISETTAGLTFRISSPLGTAEIATALHGRFNAFNVAVAIMAVAGLGFAFREVAAAAAHLLPVEGRMQEVSSASDIRVVVDYAHTPDALANSLGALAHSCTGSLWVVFGCGGDRDRGKRPDMGLIASQLADRVIITNDNPRSEDPAAIANDIIAGCTSADVHIELDRAEAIRLAISSAAIGDTVLVAGKGHETYQQVGSERHSFSDAVFAERALRDREVRL